MFTLKTVKISRNPIPILYNSNNYANFAKICAHAYAHALE